MDPQLLTITSTQLRVEVLTIGASLVGLWCTDAAGRVDNVVLRHAELDTYRDPARNPYLGSMVGRYANRIAGARFELDGQRFELAANEGTTCLHGGRDGWSFRDWDVIDLTAGSVTLSLVSPDGDQGFPGEVHATVTYRLDEATLHVDAEATTTAATPISMTNHAYWNLAGGGPIDDHVLAVGADRVVEVDQRLLPNGSTSHVVNTPLDLRGGVPIGDRRLDHCWWPELAMQTVALSHPNGRSFTLTSNQPSIQVYTGDGLGDPWGARGGICLEPQHLPDAPNQHGFPESTVRPGERYRHRTQLRFSSMIAPGAG